MEPPAATASPVETLNAAIQNSTLDARTSKVSVELTSKSTPTVGTDHSQVSETHNGEDSTASTSNSSSTIQQQLQQSLGSRTVDLGEPLASSNRYLLSVTKFTANLYCICLSIDIQVQYRFALSINIIL